MKHPIKLYYIAIAVPADQSSDRLMDALSDLRDDPHGAVLEWAIAPQPAGNFAGQRVGILADGESPEMIELFESNRVSPSQA